MNSKIFSNYRLSESKLFVILDFESVNLFISAEMKRKIFKELFQISRFEKDFIGELSHVGRCEKA